ncbi:MAG TPA: YccF domain-containing protein [Kouleothrix sp.]|uniref:YccF domain-containing protein n=1 Tax=Kouleothrix sp. TaxID=2779161 RepID=UPI002B706D0E|nr:YccF domain-containing protein [Kouleothrix sp.]HRC77227.1 YccF domain-containing protein [Kouleothrix sp.]
MSAQPVIIRDDGASLLVRAIYFVLVGWWFSAIWAVLAWLLCVSVLGLPIGLYMLNRLPQVVTLKPQRGAAMLTPTGQVVFERARQRPLLLRAIYFVLVGWWLSAIWIAVAWALHASIVGMLVGFWMFDRVPAIVTLAR